jgi:GNAT superfamily N-acetyltransferase
LYRVVRILAGRRAAHTTFVQAGMSELYFREARRQDVQTIVGMLVADPLGATREASTDPLPESYYSAFDAIESDPNQRLIVACVDDEVIGVLQMTLIPYLTYQGGRRALIEAVRVHESHRGRGIGQALVEEAIDRARGAGCHLVQLTTDKRRPEALRFYERLGFRATHEGMKLHL